MKAVPSRGVYLKFKTGGSLHCTHPFMHLCTTANARARAMRQVARAGGERGALFPWELRCTGTRGSALKLGRAAASFRLHMTTQITVTL